MGQHESYVDKYIKYLARKIAGLYPSNCADEDDYIQVGHLKLAEMQLARKDEHDFDAYTFIAISRAITEAALNATCAISAPNRVKKQVHRLEMLLFKGRTEQEINEQLQITHSTFIDLLRLSIVKSLYELFQEPEYNSEPFSVLNDLLSSSLLTEEDRTFIIAQLNGEVDTMNLSRKQRWLRAKSLRPKLERGGYGI